jgi:prepilin-type processing-associated H-X9-DG protein
LLPLLEQSPIDKRLSLTAVQNAELRSVRVPFFLCPSDVTPPTFDVYGPYQAEAWLSLPSANYVGVYGTSEADDDHPTPPGDGTFINARPVTWAELHRGLSNVLMVGERSTSQFSSSWLGFDRRDEDAECRVVGSALVHPNCATCDECEFSSRHSGVSGFLLGDGHVRSIAGSIDQTVYQQMARRLE